MEAGWAVLHICDTTADLIRDMIHKCYVLSQMEEACHNESCHVLSQQSCHKCALTPNQPPSMCVPTWLFLLRQYITFVTWPSHLRHCLTFSIYVCTYMHMHVCICVNKYWAIVFWQAFGRGIAVCIHAKPFLLGFDINVLTLLPKMSFWVHM